MRISHDQLTDLVTRVFAAAGCSEAEAGCIARHLVEANLVGHDSHGVIRVSSYVDWLRAGKVLANQSIGIIHENDSLAVLDGKFGFGQSIGEQAVRLGVEKCRRSGVSVVTLRNSGHLGRIGDWAIMAADAGLLSLHFVNTTGAGILAAPFGGTQRRLSANPIAAGVPMPGQKHLVLDISTSSVAEGKIRVALNKGEPVPEGCIVDSLGQPTTDPKVFYGPPPGAILPMAGHKGYGLAVICEVLAGALTGGGCSDPAKAGSVLNGMLSIYLDPAAFGPGGEFTADIERFVAWVKSSATTTPAGHILMPGEIEEQTKAERLRDGIKLDDTTWQQISKTCESVGVAPGRH